MSGHVTEQLKPYVTNWNSNSISFKTKEQCKILQPTFLCLSTVRVSVWISVTLVQPHPLATLLFLISTQNSQRQGTERVQKTTLDAKGIISRMIQILLLITHSSLMSDRFYIVWRERKKQQHKWSTEFPLIACYVSFSRSVSREALLTFVSITASRRRAVLLWTCLVPESTTANQSHPLCVFCSEKHVHLLLKFNPKYVLKSYSFSNISSNWTLIFSI